MNYRAHSGTTFLDAGPIKRGLSRKVQSIYVSIMIKQILASMHIFGFNCNDKRGHPFLSSAGVHVSTLVTLEEGANKAAISIHGDTAFSVAHSLNRAKLQALLKP